MLHILVMHGDATLLISSNAHNSVTLQEAEKRMILDCERALAASQDEPEVVATTGRTAPHALNNSTNSNNLTNPDNRAETSRHSRVLSLEGWKLLLTHFLMCIYVSSEEAK